MTAVVGQYVVTALLFGLLDGLWLSFAANRVYRPRYGTMMAERPSAPAAVAFYLIYVAGIVYFAVRPALADASPEKAAVAGAALGLVAYATWNLTGAAVLRDYPASIVPIDMAWGAAATCGAGWGAYAICSRIDALT